MRKSAESIIAEDLMIYVGVGATLYNGRDSYPYYVAEILPDGGVGLYQPHARFDSDHPWEAGYGVVDPFDPNHPSEICIKRRYGRWWTIDKDTKKPIEKFTDRYHSLKFGHACFYQDPSF